MGDDLDFVNVAFTAEPTSFPTIEPTTPFPTAPTNEPSSGAPTVETSEPTYPPTGYPTMDPTANPSASHYVAAGKPSHSVWDNLPLFECMDDSADQTAVDTDPWLLCGQFNGGDTDITVSCCEMDGSGGERDTNGLDCHSPATYDEAVSYCEGAGMRLCTLNEMLSAITEATGCGFDCRYNWVSTECTETPETTDDDSDSIDVTGDSDDDDSDTDDDSDDDDSDDDDSDDDDSDDTDSDDDSAANQTPSPNSGDTSSYEHTGAPSTFEPSSVPIDQPSESNR